MFYVNRLIILCETFHPPLSLRGQLCNIETKKLSKQTMHINSTKSRYSIVQWRIVPATSHGYISHAVAMNNMMSIIPRTILSDLDQRD